MVKDRLIRVAFLVNSLEIGGAEKQTIQLFNELDDSIFRVELAYLRRKEHLVKQIKPKKIGQVCCLDFGPGWNTLGFRRLNQWLEKFSPDILACVNQYPLFYGKLSQYITRRSAKIAVIFHSTILQQLEYLKMRMVYCHFFNYSDRIVYVSEAQRRYWESKCVHNAKGACIHNGVDNDFFQNSFSKNEIAAFRGRNGFSIDDFVVGICATLRPKKNHEDLLSAIALLKKAGLNVKCLIIGDGPQRSTIECKINKLSLTKNIVITGFQQDVRPYISACDCIAIVSHTETFSIAVLEAMAMGKPIIMSDLGGAAEQIIHGEHGFLYERGDIAALAKFLKEMSDPELAQRMGFSAAKRVRKMFGIEKMVTRYEALLHNLYDDQIRTKKN